MSALALWTGANLLLMLVLALNVSRLRIKNMRDPVDPEVLEKAVRAHGNNIEYVPAALLGAVNPGADGTGWNLGARVGRLAVPRSGAARLRYTATGTGWSTTGQDCRQSADLGGVCGGRP